MDGDRDRGRGKSRRDSSEVITREDVEGDRLERAQDAARKHCTKYITPGDREPTEQSTEV